MKRSSPDTINRWKITFPHQDFPGTSLPLTHALGLAGKNLAAFDGVSYMELGEKSITLHAKATLREQEVIAVIRLALEKTFKVALAASVEDRIRDWVRKRTLRMRA